MANDVVIRAEGLGKKYLVGHRADRERHPVLRDVIAGTVRQLARSAIDMAHGRQLVQGDNVEEFWALKDVSFEIRRGEVVGIIGRNGSGKSTLLKILSRITEPSAGRAEIRGRVASLLEVGTGFHPELSGRENIYLNGAILGMTRAEIKRKFDEIVAFAEVETFLDTPVKRYSSGMYMRLAFAVAAHLEPEILVVDEVLGVGDAEFQKKWLGKMRDVASDGRTVLFVSHNMNSIQALCTNVILLHRGNLLRASANVSEVINSYNAARSSQSTSWIRQPDAPSNGAATLDQFYIGNASGTPITHPVTNDRETYLHFKFTISDSLPDLAVGFVIYAEDGTELFTSYSFDNTPGTYYKLSPGKAWFRVLLPRRTLNEDEYSLEPMVMRHYSGQWLYQPGANAPRICLTIRGGLSDCSLWQEPRPGLLAPVLQWALLEPRSSAAGGPDEDTHCQR